MKAHEERVVEEKKELDAKIDALKIFMHGDIFASLVPIGAGLLMVQLVAMENYSTALERRIELFEE